MPLIEVLMLAAPYFGPHKRLYLDTEEKQYYLRIQLPKNLPEMKISSCWRKIHPCGKIMRRPHSICFSCWYLKRQRNQIPEYNKVELIISPIRINRPYANVGDRIGKRLHEALKYVWE
jgi:hypothetical protein